MDEKKRRLIIVALAVLIVGGGFGYWWVNNASAPDVPSGIAAEQAAGGPTGQLVVYVSGAVVKPGVYKMASNSRVIDVVNTAGGLAAAADVNRVNLAKLVKDGMQVYVPVVGGRDHPAGRVAEAASAASASAAVAPLKVSINTGAKSDLEKLSGIGPALAQRIVEYRQANGPFQDVIDLKKVSGIGDAKFNQMKDQITL